MPGHALLHRRLRGEAQPGIVHAQMPVEHDLVGEPLELLERAESAVDGAVLGAAVVLAMLLTLVHVASFDSVEIGQSTVDASLSSFSTFFF